MTPTPDLRHRVVLFTEDDPMLLFNVTDQVRETIQQTLYLLLRDRGSAFGR